jgi:3-hydroxyisobutyrate dehydrogenase-like beta-hydroxyacid dehydrogenase
MRVGFIGLGQMGAGMALNLVKAGHEVTVYNRTPAKAADGSPTARCIAAISCC